MSTLVSIMDAMADVIRTEITDHVTDLDVQVEPRMVLTPTPPCIDMLVGEPSEDDQLGGFGELDGGEVIIVRARVNTADTYAGQDLLLAFMDDEDPLSIRAALNTDHTLNGTVTTVDVEFRSGYTLFPMPQGDGALLGCQWRVIVAKDRSSVGAFFGSALYGASVYGA